MSGLRWRLSAMMFLEYAVWGAWSVVLASYLAELKFTGNQVGVIFSILPLACAVMPIPFGQLADRYFSTERLLFVLLLVSGISMFLMAQTTNYGQIVLWMSLFSIAYAPTLALTNSICFRNMQASEKEFGYVRVFGTIGWIAAGLVLAGWRGLAPVKADLLYLAGVFSILLALFSFFLPHTPPKREGTNPFAFLEALRLFKNPNFTVFMIISFVVGTELEFYYMLTSPFLNHLGVPDATIPAVMTIAQIAEIVVMAGLLPIMLPKMGARKLLAIGVIAWPLRYAIFAVGHPLWLIEAALSLHGICYVFFFVVGFIYVDQIAPVDIKASAQSLIAIVVLGFGRFLGSRLAGITQDWFTSDGIIHWQQVFLVPCVLTVLCAVAFLLFFREERKIKSASEVQPA
ncbi:MAG: MFS transporter [Armatimonadetes bacterium]|nr:MFS transporter [Armatimonadota bacterium]